MCAVRDETISRSRAGFRKSSAREGAGRGFIARGFSVLVMSSRYCSRQGACTRPVCSARRRVRGSRRACRFTGREGGVGVAGFDLAGSLGGMMERIADGRGAREPELWWWWRESLQGADRRPCRDTTIVLYGWFKRTPGSAGAADGACGERAPPLPVIGVSAGDGDTKARLDHATTTTFPARWAVRPPASTRSRLANAAR